MVMRTNNTVMDLGCDGIFAAIKIHTFHIVKNWLHNNVCRMPTHLGIKIANRDSP